MEERFSRYAIASVSLVGIFILGIYSLAHVPSTTPRWLARVIVPIVICTPIAATVCDFIARKEVRRSGYIRGGYGTGTAGLILGFLILAAMSYLYLMVLGTRSLNGVDLDESAAQSSLRVIGLALFSYSELHPDSGFPDSLEQLLSDAAVRTAMNTTRWKMENDVTDEEQTGYRFSYRPSKSRANAPNDSFQLFADPTRHQWHERRHFYLDQTRVLRYSLNRPG